MSKQYTVYGIYLDNRETCSWKVKAENVEQALEKAAEKVGRYLAKHRGEGFDPELDVDFRALFVFEGKPNEVWRNDEYED